jgi:phosphoglycolate phosphatase
MVLRLVVFDFDGTLADSRGWATGALDDAAVRYGFRRVEAGELEALRGLDTAALLHALRVPRWKLPLIARHMRRLASESPPPALFDGVAPMLARLAASGVTLALVTSNTEANARRALGPTAATITHWTCGAALFGKAAKFRALLRAAGVAPGDAIGIGDEQRDIAAAHAAGMRAGAVTWGYATPASLAAARPDMLFDQVESIGDALVPR